MYTDFIQATKIHHTPKPPTDIFQNSRRAFQNVYAFIAEDVYNKAIV
jgi:hypothetical protein